MSPNIAAENGSSASGTATPSASRRENMAALLDKHFLGVHKLRVGQVTITEYTRPVNARGLKRVMDSIAVRGWDSSKTPYVIVPREQIPSGKDTVFTPALVETLNTLSLDGNHRLLGLLKLKGADFVVECRLYMDFGDARVCTNLASTINTMTGASADVTTFDRIFSTMKSMEAIMAAKNITDKCEVSATMLAEAMRMGGDEPPSNPQLCANKRLVIGFSGEGFAALRAVSESEDKCVDVTSLSKNLLDSPIILTDLREHPLEQSIIVHILARYKKFNGKAPAKADLPKLKDRVMKAGVLHRQVENVISRELWDPEFERSFLLGIIYAKTPSWKTWGLGHLQEREAEVKALENHLPAGYELSEDHINTIKEKLPPSLEKVAKKSTDLRPFVEQYEQRMAEVTTFIEQHKNLPGNVEKEEESSSDDEDEVLLCESCSPLEATGYYYPEGGTHHLASYEDTVRPDKKNSDRKERRRVGCAGSQPPSKKRKKSKRSMLLLPTADTNAVELSMSRSTMIHSGPLFAGRGRKYTEHALKVNTAPKLVVVDLTGEENLFKNTDLSKNMLKNVLKDVVEILDPQGTMAVAYPRPWHTRGAAVAGALEDIDNAVVEDNPLVLMYETVCGGAIKSGTENHIRNQMEIVLLVHRPCLADKPFTCNRSVVLSDVKGLTTGRKAPHAKQVLRLESLPAGAPNGGSRSFFPGKAAHFLVARYTNVTDTVLGIGVETTTVAEEAIEQGRCVEFYVTDEGKREMLKRKITDAFRVAHGRGMFQSRRKRETWIGPTVLPTGLQPTTVPGRATEFLEECQRDMPRDHDGACFNVAQDIASDSNYNLKQAFEPDAAVKKEAQVQISCKVEPTEAKGEHDRDRENNLREDAGPASCLTANVNALVKPALVTSPPPMPQGNRKKR